MNANFKPLGLAAAVATATAGYAGYANAQASFASATELGDLAIVPYYTVQEGFTTGVNIINTSERTQVIKFRFRRAPDSMDALDFNVVLSPKDMYTGFLALEGDDITFTSNDNSCTAPAYNGGPNKFVMPGIYREGAETGYVEVISMGSPILTPNPIAGQPALDNQPVAIAAKHDADGVPANCDAVRDNFFANGSAAAPLVRGVVNSVTTVGPNIAAAGAPLATSTYEASPDSLKVSYFINDTDSGVEFGDNAVHIAGFLAGASITNQQTGVFSGDLQGFDHPDLHGGAPASRMVAGAAQTGKYAELRTALAAEELINDWSANVGGDFSVDTDWVVTIPGQYVMLNLPLYLNSLIDPDAPCLIGDPALATATSGTTCDFRDIPMRAVVTVYDREEQGIVVEEGELVVSPQPPQIIENLDLEYEVNVIEWGDAPVLQAPVAISGLDVPAGARFGWSSLVATSSAAKTQGICDYIGPGINIPGTTFPAMACAATDTPAPIVGFVAWQRNLPAVPAANYGRIVEHSRVQASSS